MATLTESSLEEVTMKKLLKILLVLVILGAGGYFGYQYYTERYATATQEPAGSGYTEYVISRGNLSKTVTGTGTLSISQTRDISLDCAVTVTNVLAEAGEAVSEGQALLAIDTAALQTTIDTLQEELDACESDMAGIADSFSSTTYIKMPQYGRIKEVYISAGQYIQDVMAEKGCIALLSLDGWMYVETDAVDGMEISSTVKVRVGRATLDGTVRALENGKATVTFSDAYGTEGGEVELTFGNQTLGTAAAHIHMPYRLTTTEKGYIYAVYMEENARKWEGNKIAYLINVPVPDSYQTLQSTREKLTGQIQALKSLLRAGSITAPADGIVASIVEASATEQAAYTTLASLYVGDEKEMVVSVDELDIISVAVGQDTDIAMDAITGKTYSATVSKVSQIGTSESGVTVYDVTLTIDGDEQLKLGMNGTATIKIEEVSDVLLVPISAMNSSRNGSYVWVKSESQTGDSDEPGVRAYIETGLSDEDFAEVTSGLSEGDVVLITREASTSSNSGFGGMGAGMMMDMGGGMPAGGGAVPSGGGAPSGGGSGGGRPGGN